MDEVFAGDLGRLHAPMEIKNTETIKQAVIAGMDISFLSAHTISLEVQAGLLTVLDVVDFPILRQWGVAHHVDKRLAPVALAFKHFLIEEGAAHIARLTGVSRAGRVDAIA
jgi:DNA-binding transcriptional LysR family regulator